MAYNKKFIIIGNGNAVTYKEIFPLIKNNEMRIGDKSFSGGMDFIAGHNFDASRCKQHPKYDEAGNVLITVPMCIWFTNIDHAKRNTPLSLTKRYIPENYPKYVDCDAIEVSKVSDIPVDYDGVMGVPITFLDRWCPDQFEIVGRTAAMLLEKSPIDCEWSELLCDVRQGYTRILIKRR